MFVILNSYKFSLDMIIT